MGGRFLGPQHSPLQPWAGVWQSCLQTVTTGVP